MSTIIWGVDSNFTRSTYGTVCYRQYRCGTSRPRCARRSVAFPIMRAHRLSQCMLRVHPRHTALELILFNARLGISYTVWTRIVLYVRLAAITQQWAQRRVLLVHPTQARQRVVTRLRTVSVSVATRERPGVLALSAMWIFIAWVACQPPVQYTRMHLLEVMSCPTVCATGVISDLNSRIW
jgi:hypothetical protein